MQRECECCHWVGHRKWVRWRAYYGAILCLGCLQEADSIRPWRKGKAA